MISTCLVIVPKTQISDDLRGQPEQQVCDLSHTKNYICKIITGG